MFNKTDELVLHTLMILTNLTNNQTPRGTVTNYQLSKGTQSENTTCYGDLGCYSTNYPWTDQSRPIAHFPIPPDELDPEFCLYTRRNYHECQRLDFRDPQSIIKSNLIPSKRVYLISHGFLENGFKPWILIMMRRLLQRNDCNVIGIDWQKGSSPPYTQAVANIRLVGTFSARLIHTLHKEVGVKTEYCHFIGHSLGAHLAGYAGNLLQTEYGLKLGRISGLDPAEPHFSKTDPVVRLDHTDAIFVDIIHTDAAPFIEGGLGMDEAIGHIDFYPNGGDNQPGCNHAVQDYINLEDGSIIKGMRRYLGCDHVRSYEYFIETIKEDCAFLAIECDSYENFLAGKCFTCQTETKDGLMCAQMGFNSIKSIQRGGALTFDLNPKANRTAVTLYTLTNSAKPFCNALYRVTVLVSNSKESIEHKGEVGIFSVRLDGISSMSDKITLFREQPFKPGSRYTQVVGAKQVGRIRSVKLLWVHRISLNILTWRFGDPFLHIERVRVDNLEEESSGEFCLHNKEKMVSGIEETLRPCSSTNDAILLDEMTI